MDQKKLINDIILCREGNKIVIKKVRRCVTCKSIVFDKNADTCLACYLCGRINDKK